jgi:hypothetical protein
VVSAFVQHERPLGARVTANVALSAAAASGNVYPLPQAQLRWTPSPPVTLSASYARAHQFSQSLRNAESIVGNVFPADLYVGANAVSLDAAVSGARYGFLASYGWQRVRLEHGDSSYVPDHAVAQVAEAGVIVFPSATSSVRLGATGALGRRTTAVMDALEWEPCNLLDLGCELGGSPRHDTGKLGAARLPAYLRVDLGFRKHWHLDVAGRDGQVALFGTVTNLLGRRNVLTVATDPSTAEPFEVGMRPLAPLVVGLDWRF